MEIAYLDTSALVKRYHKEEYSDIIDEIFEKYVISISELTIVELTSALRKKVDEKEIRQKEMFRVLTKFYEDLTDFIVLKFDSEVISNAVDLIIRYRLKTLDSLQLAFAIKLKDYDPLFISFDRKLINSAKSEGFKVLEI
ncbi:MAG: type II toxin-antitoxin system VapC family toxin [Archaeoglobaceae archaeon]|nr:type II toxin-antitoxin system VapC family toxin [Archaeoglobaceae archaeon]